MKNKPKFSNYKSCSISKKTRFGKNVFIGPNVVIKGDCIIDDNVVIEQNCQIVDSVVGRETTIAFSVLEKSKIGKGCTIGPFSRIRPNSEIGDNVKIGNFVEIKNSKIGANTKAAHLAYIGDADIGENVNIGCGVIFVNYNGKEKNRTIVGDGAFVGSNCNIIAPVNIAERSYICAGTTVTQSTNFEDFVIGRVKQEVKPNRANKYLKWGKFMGIYFGTDGIRGIVNNDLTDQIAQMVGNALARKRKKAKILIGRDTRISGSYLLVAIATGALKGGADVVDAGVLPTPAISFLVKNKNFDYGVVVSASHNPKEYNGIKIFNSEGKKLSEKEESELERLFACPQTFSSLKVGSFKSSTNLKNIYINYLKSISYDLTGLKVVLDCSNGASYLTAPRLFKSLGAQVIKTACSNNGKKINENCGSTHIENLKKRVLEEKASVGFAFDGDADRIVAVDENGEIFDGDKLLYILAVYLKEKDLLNGSTVVGTSHTNTGLLIGLNKKKINLIRTDVGDKYVIDAMEKMNLSLGGEQSGHIIMKPFLPTGDGVLNALQIAGIMKAKNKTLNELFDAKLLPQINKNIVVEDKLKVLNNEKLAQKILQISNEIAPSGRILVRASGTEPKIRIMLEHPNEEKAKMYVGELEKIIKQI